VRKPVADAGSKSVMLAAERHDIISIVDVENQISDDNTVQQCVSVKQRHNTFYGPKLLVECESEREYLLTAPGPDRYLYLWGENVTEFGTRESWFKLAEVQATLNESRNRYHLCHECNEPLKTAEHEKLAAIGQCPNV
jgi:hypothetical protein